MTISTTQSFQNFIADGVSNTFDFNFIADNASYISVMVTTSSGTTTLNPSVYSITLNAPAVGAIWGYGGVVTYPLSGSPLALGTIVTISRTLPLTQTTSISNQGVFYPQVVEAEFDTIVMQVQQIAARTGQFKGTWQTGIQYSYGDVIVDGANGANTGNYYLCAIANLSTVWSTNLTAGDWSLMIDIQQIEEAEAAAEAAAIAAATSATNAASSATASATSATASANSATASATSATNSANSATASATSATDSANSATASAASAASAAAYAAALTGTSTSSLAIGTGAKTFTTQASKQFINGQFLVIASGANDANYMHGQITSYSGTSLVMNITDIGGSGTHADWNISISGTQGPTGPAGPSGGIDSVSGTSNRITATAGANPVIDISASYVGQASITTVGTIGSGTWNGTGIDVAHGGTGQSSYTDGQLLIGNTTGNTLTKGTLTPGTGIAITNAAGAITVATTGVLLAANNLSDLGSTSTARTNLGLVPGTSANDIVQLDGSAKLPAVDGSQLTNLPIGMVLIQSQTVSSVSVVSFTSGINSTYSNYRLICSNMSATDTGEGGIRVSQAASFKSDSNYIYSSTVNGVYTKGTGNVGSGTGDVQFSINIGNMVTGGPSSAPVGFLDVNFGFPAATRYKVFDITYNDVNTNTSGTTPRGYSNQEYLSGIYSGSTGAIDGVQFFTSGISFSGTFNLYGIK